MWVQVPQLTNNSYIWAYWGNTGAGAAPAPYTINGATWDQTAFAGVWHMVQPNTLDSTANGNNGTATGSVSSAIGLIDGAQQVSSRGFVRIPDASSLDFTAPAATVSGWVNFNTLPTGANQEQAIIRKENQWVVEANLQGGTLYMRNVIQTGNGGTNGWTAANDDAFSPSLVAGNWYYFAFTYDGSHLWNFENGVPIGASPHPANGNIQLSGNQLGLGASAGGSGNNPGDFGLTNAVIDELRVEKVFRSTNWVLATYMTVASNTSFSAYGNVLTAGTVYTITATAGPNGSINPSGAVGVLISNDQAFAMSGNSGYVVTNVVVDGSSIGASNSYTFHNVQTNHTISAYFGYGGGNFTITASADPNGSISPSGAVSVPSGSNQTFTITGNSGYIVTNVVVDGSSIGATTSYTFYAVTASHTISAYFGVSAGNSWPCDRGPNKDGSTTETIASWPPKEIWRSSIGQGYSQVIVGGGKVYTMGYSNGHDQVYCFNESSMGTNPAVVWQAQYPGKSYISSPGYYGTVPTPTLDLAASKLYTFGTTGLVYCFDAATGNTNWGASVALGLPMYGFCGSPLIEGSNVIVNAGQYGVALNKLTGQTNWVSVGSYTAGFSTPYALTVGTQRTVVVFSSYGCYGVDPASGTVLWSYAFSGAGYNDPGSIYPIIYNNQLWVAQNGECAGAAALVNLGSGVLSSVVWQTNSLVGGCGDNPSVLYNGYIYGPAYAEYDYGDYEYDIGGGFQCVNITNGVVQWQSNASDFGEYSSVIRAGTQLVIMAGASGQVSGTNGILVVANPTPGGYQEVYRTNGILTGQTFTPPTLCNGKLYVRNNTGVPSMPATLICYDVSGGGSGGSSSNVPPTAWMVNYYPLAPTNTYGTLAASIASNGMTVWQCCLAGLSPIDPNSALKVGITLANGNVVVTYPTKSIAGGLGYTASSRTYGVQSVTSLLSGTWQFVPGATNIPGNNSTAGYTNASPTGNIFYRVKLMEQ